MSTLGVHSEVGKLRTVMVCRPGLAHQRLTPGNCKDLLFDDVLWVHEAQKDHYDFVLKMQERGVEVLELHDMLAQTLEKKEARKFVLDRRITGNAVGVGTAKAIRPWLDEMPAKTLADHLIGGISIGDLPDGEVSEIPDGSIRGRGFRAAADSQHAVPARPVVLDLRRRHVQSDVLAGAPAGNAVAARGLQVPPDVCRARFQDLVGRLRRKFRRRVGRRRRRDADRQRQRADRHGRAHDAAGGAAGRIGAVQEQGGDARGRMPDAEEPRSDAPRYRVHVLQSRRRDAVSRSRRPDPLLQHLSEAVPTGDVEVRRDDKPLLGSSKKRSG